jgi:hypothetical protein
MFKNISRKEMCAIVFASSWTALGFYRGIIHHDYMYPKKKDTTKKTYLYSKELLYQLNRIVGGGLYGIFIYINPFIIFTMIPREMYRLEVDIRGLEDEKKTDDYNRL